MRKPILGLMTTLAELCPGAASAPLLLITDNGVHQATWKRCWAPEEGRLEQTRYACVDVRPAMVRA